MSIHDSAAWLRKVTWFDLICKKTAFP
jgi:hypothetical protein